MSYQAVDIPFFKGQDESVDRKVLPVGPLRRVENAYQERTGRMVEMRGLTSRDTTDTDGSDRSQQEYLSSLPRDRVLVHDVGREGAALYWDKGDIHLVEGRIGGPWSFEDEWQGGPTEKGPNTFSPCAAFITGHIVFVYISGVTPGQSPRSNIGGALTGRSDVNLIIFDSETMRVVRRDKWSYGSTNAEQALEVKVVGHDSSRRFQVFTRTGDNLLKTERFNDETGERAPGADISIYANSTFDVGLAHYVNLAAVGFTLAYVTPILSLTVEGRRVETETISNTASGSVPAPPAGQTLFVGTAMATTFQYYGVASYNGDLHVATYSSADLGVTTSTRGNGYAPACGIGVDNILLLGYGNRQSRASTAGVIAGTEGVFSKANAVGVIHDTGSTNSTRYGKYVVREDLGLNEIRGTVSIVANGFVASDSVEVWPSAVLLQAGGSDSTRFRTTTAAEAYENLKWTPSSPVESDNRGVGYWLVPFEERIPITVGQGDLDDDIADAVPTWSTRSGFIRMGHQTAINSHFGVEWERQSCLVSGSGMTVMSDLDFHFAGFTGRPGISLSTVTIPDDAGPGAGTYTYTAVMEYVDSLGRVWRGPPSDPEEITISGTTVGVQYNVSACAGFPIGSRIVIYRTEDMGSISYRINDIRAVADYSVPLDTVDYLKDDVLAKNAILYTNGGVKGNDPPPACKYLARTRDRFWAGRLNDGTRVQASKFVRPAEGIHWSNFDSFFIDLPEACTGLAAMDDTLVAFSDSGIYLVHGDGPNDQGIGSFSPAQTVPTDVGCVDARSIAVAGMGVFFQSRRGIELLGRGFSEPLFIGDPVRDVVNAFPHCSGSIVLEDDKQVRWLMSDKQGEATAEVRVIVYDLRLKTWYVFDHGEAFEGIGRSIVKDTIEASTTSPPDGMTTYRGPLSNAKEETIAKGPASIVQTWETAELRPAGLNAGTLGRRFHLLGTYEGECDVSVTMAFNDKKDFDTSKYKKTWQLRAADYSAGDPVSLELTLPIMKFWAARFLITATKVTDGAEGFRAHGVTVFFDTEGEGPRVGARSKG